MRTTAYRFRMWVRSGFGSVRTAKEKLVEYCAITCAAALSAMASKRER